MRSAAAPALLACTATADRGEAGEAQGAEGECNVRNTHERWWPVAPEKVGPLLDSLASEDDRLWPVDDWPPMTFDRPLGVGATGGHGSMTYTVVAYTPGRMVTFELTPGLGLRGHHRFVVEPQTRGGHAGTVVRHEASARVHGRMVWMWPLITRWVHDAVVEDALDCCHRELMGTPPERPARWSPWVRRLRVKRGLPAERSAPREA